MDAGSAQHSRFQILTEGRPAWACDRKGQVFEYDGFWFWQPARRGKRRPAASWECPSYGWSYLAESPRRLQAQASRESGQRTTGAAAA